MEQLPFRVGEWTVEPARGLAHCRDESIRLEPKTVELLAYLVSRRGEVVSRTELLDAVWPNVTVGDAVITNKIANLRRIFGDTTKASSFIETIPKRGYRLVAAVDQICGNGSAPGEQTYLVTPDTPSAQVTPPARSRASTVLWAFAIVPSLIVIGGAWYCRDHWMPQLAGALSVAQMNIAVADGPSIAVLPFANFGGDAQQDYFVDGVTDDLITDLSKISGLSVVDRTSVFKYKANPTNIKDVAQELGVRYVLEGSVHRAGDQIRINAKLIDATTGRPLWAERFDLGAGDIPRIRHKITANIVSALAVKAGMN